MYENMTETPYTNLYSNEISRENKTRSSDRMQHRKQISHKVLKTTLYNTIH